MSENPYSTPMTASAEPVTQVYAPSRSRDLQEVARHVFWEWEKLRLWYVGILGILTLLLLSAGTVDLRTLADVCAGAFAANVLYFAGPILETYIRWLGFNSNWPRRIMFTSGTLFATVLAFVYLASRLLPNQL